MWRKTHRDLTFASPRQKYLTSSDYPIFVYNFELSNFPRFYHAIFSIKENPVKILPGEDFLNMKDDVRNLENDVPNKLVRNF